MISTANHLQATADCIRRLLENGMTASPELCRYLNTMYDFGQRIEILSENEADSANCSLIDLIFSPDTAFQLELEPFLETHHFSKEQIQVVSHLLLQPPPVTTVRFNSTIPDFSVQMPNWCATSFIKRLHIDFRLPDPIRHLIDEQVPQPDRSGTKVMFRNFHPRLSENKYRFIQSFFNGVDLKQHEFMKDLTFLVSILDEFEDETDQLEALISKKRFYHRHLQEALRLEGQLAKSNVETLLLGGVRIHPIHAEEAREKMQYIDRITLAVTGRVVWLTDERMEIAYETANLP